MSSPVTGEWLQIRAEYDVILQVHVLKERLFFFKNVWKCYLSKILEVAAVTVPHHILLQSSQVCRGSAPCFESLPL